MQSISRQNYEDDAEKHQPCCPVKLREKVSHMTHACGIAASLFQKFQYCFQLPAKEMQRLQTKLSKYDGSRDYALDTTDIPQILLIQLLQARPRMIGSSHSRNAPTQCAFPKLHTMMYSRNEDALGQPQFETDCVNILQLGMPLLYHALRACSLGT